MEPHERVGVVLCAFLLGGLLAEYLMMARLGAVFFFFVGVVAFFTDAALGLGRSMEPETVPGALVVTGEELSGKASDRDDDDCGYGSPVKRYIQEKLGRLPRTPEEIQKRWPDTFRLDCLALRQPLSTVTTLSTSWRDYLRPMKQDNRTCTIMACTMAVEGMHYKVYESFHGSNTFRDDWKAADDWTEQLLKTCGTKGIWKEGEGAIVGDVLSEIKESLGGVRTASGKGPQEVMPLREYKKHSGDKLTRTRVAELIDQGPCVVRYFACPWHGCFDATENDNWVYRGCGTDKVTRNLCQRKYPGSNVGSHVVVCFAYRTCQNGEMHVCVLDNHTDAGPERWVDVEELDAVYSLKVDCMCGSPAHYHDAPGNVA